MGPTDGNDERWTEADEGRESRQEMLRAGVVLAGILVGLFGLLYAFLWVPFNDPATSVPLPDEVRHLPLTPPAPVSGAERPAEFGWVDREAGVVTMPVEEAMRVVVQKLPVEKGVREEEDRRRKRQVPTDAGSGHYPRRDRDGKQE